MRRSGPILAFVGTLLVGCVVTDTIEFSDKVNHPPEVIGVEPSNSAVATVCPGDITFSVTAWDPDEEDSSTYESRLFLRLDPYATGAWSVAKSCDVSAISSLGEGGEEETGVVVNAVCQLDLGLYVSIQPGALLLVRVQLADLGYRQNVVKEEARTADVFWVLEVAPQSACVD